MRPEPTALNGALTIIVLTLLTAFWKRRAAAFSPQWSEFVWFFGVTPTGFEWLSGPGDE
jgi:hypothetical protein